jgi:hypothetical protein
VSVGTVFADDQPEGLGEGGGGCPRGRGGEGGSWPQGQGPQVLQFGDMLKQETRRSCICIVSMGTELGVSTAPTQVSVGPIACV